MILFICLFIYFLDLQSLTIFCIHSDLQALSDKANPILGFALPFCHHFLSIHKELQKVTKMVTNLEILSKEMIKPSSPTPHHLRNLQLSLLDQIAPSAYIPLIFFYNANQLQSSNKDHPKIAQILK